MYRVLVVVALDEMLVVGGRGGGRKGDEHNSGDSEDEDGRDALHLAENDLRRGRERG